MLHRYLLLLATVLTLHPALPGQRWTAAAIETASQQQLALALAELREFVALPNDGKIAEQRAANGAWFVNALERRQLRAQTLVVNSIPFVFAEQVYHPGAPTVLFYCQLDGQPADPQAWDQADPFQVTLKAPGPDGSWTTLDWSHLATGYAPEWRLFGRSTSDSKGPALALLHALDVLLAAGETPRFNVRIIGDLQEEISSPELPSLVAEYPDLLAAAYLVVMDGTRHVSNLPTLTFGARGIATANLRVFGPAQPMHSGQYGNFVPNPVFRLSKLIAGMKDDDGRVLIPGWYDGITLSEADKALLNAVPENADSIARAVGIARPERVGETYQESLQYPTLNVRGLRAAYVGNAARTIIPDEAIAMFDIRLVPESDGARLLGLLEAYIREQGYHLLTDEPTLADRHQYDKLAQFNGKVSYAAYRTELASPIGNWLRAASVRTFGAEPVLMRTTGGSQPIAPFIQALGLPAVSVRIPNPDNNIHAPNENLRLGNFLEGIRTCLGILTEPVN
ncbi:M20/M25/M40 family metallo-hydrolase [Lewinella lacunae]|uniref:M20/M25/M40 family metallo-hydrolase n=2 Tax=Neolewinella lacunae TaxID=1517758 RepID=A0A923PG86_9BACT|nr:M20/M25/M40 family metallo-hydrolase [Neolewinella lacunae]MBC6993563.1 M20/M25/M40 family metallo-hydrolase [Neolewinella lacunae]